MELTVNLPENVDPVAVLGSAERNLKLIREALGVQGTARDHTVRLRGDTEPVNGAAELLNQLSEAASKHRPMSRADLIERIHRVTNTMKHSPVAFIGSDGAAQEVYTRGGPVTARTPGQQRYLEAIDQHDLTFCVGPAGTGKTYLAVASAVSMLKRGLTRKLVLVRPAVEAGEKLGFLPGDMQQKVNPYLRPLLDALNDMMPFEQVQRFMDGDVIEIVPLAFMRGRTLNESVIIMDEAQNTTPSQMLMFLTRLGHDAKMVVTGDTTQIDLPSGSPSGLIDGVRKLRNMKGVACVTLERGDIVRHQLVQRIVEAYGGAKEDQRSATDFIEGE